MPKHQGTDWLASLENARQGLALLDEARTTLNALGDTATAEIAKYLRMDAGVDLDLDAIRATLTRPYTLLPISEQEAWLVHWRGVKLPIFGWVVKQEPAFTISRVSRGMELLTPMPAWMKDELGWRAPEHAAHLDGSKTLLHLTAGDEPTFHRRYGVYLGSKIAEGAYKIKSGGWIKLVAALMRDGILPYVPQPVAPEDWNDQAPSAIELRDYQRPFIQEFRDKGAVFFNLPPGGGKTYLVLFILSRLAGRVLILAPSVILCEQWRSRVREFAPKADVTVMTYAGGKKAMDEEWALVVFDEVQTLPADTFSKLAFLKARYRVGLSASPWREDGRQYMIAALSGFPCAVRWADLIRAGVLQRPRVIVATVANDAAKTRFIQGLLSRRPRGRALIFCDYLEQGQALANALDVPFVSGQTAHKLERVQAADVCVVSRIADRGLSFPDLKLVVEVAFLGKSREQEGQRFGRLLHGQSGGEHYILFTPQEAERLRPRIYGIEAELAGEIDIEFISVGNVPDHQKEISYAPKRSRSSTRRPTAISRPRAAYPPPPLATSGQAAPGPGDEISQFLALSPVAKLLAEAKVERPGYLPIVLRACWRARLTADKIAMAIGATSAKTRSRIAACANWLARNRLLAFDKTDRTYTVNHDTINELKALSELGRGLR